jgi:hypothetical protein
MSPLLNSNSAADIARKGSGMCLFAKRLENGDFDWPPIVSASIQMTRAQLALLLHQIHRTRH